MIKHLVVMKFKSGISENRFRDMEAGLKSLPEQIPEIKSYQFGLDVVRSERSYDFGLVADFEDSDALKRYQNHPDHLKVLDIIKELCQSILAADFTF